MSYKTAKFHLTGNINRVFESQIPPEWISDTGSFIWDISPLFSFLVEKFPSNHLNDIRIEKVKNNNEHIDLYITTY